MISSRLFCPSRQTCLLLLYYTSPSSLLKFSPRARVRGDRVHLLIISLLFSTFQFFACLGESRQKAFLSPSPLWFFLPPEILISRRRVTIHPPSPLFQSRKGGRESSDVDSRKLSPFFLSRRPLQFASFRWMLTSPMKS